MGHLHLKLRPPVRLVAEQEIRAAADIKARCNDCAQERRNPAVCSSLVIFRTPIKTAP
jgi:hypothetical protein